MESSSLEAMTAGAVMGAAVKAEALLRRSRGSVLKETLELLRRGDVVVEATEASRELLTLTGVIGMVLLGTRGCKFRSPRTSPRI